MSRLAARVEIAKLARVLGVDPSELAFLEQIPDREIRSLREAAYDAVQATDRPLLRRLARLVRLLPTRVAAILAKYRFGPMVTALVASELSARRSARITRKIPTAFLADVCQHFDPRRAKDLFRLQPIELVLAVAAELIRREEFLVIGSFVDVFPDEVIAAVEEATKDEEALLRGALYVNSKNRLDHLVRLMPRERIRKAVLLALDDSRDLMREVASLIVNVSYALKRELGEIAAEQDEAVLDRLVRFAHDEELWEDILPVIAVVSQDVQRRIVNLPILSREPVYIECTLAATDAHDLWSITLPLVRLMEEPIKVTVAAAAARQPRAAMERAAAAALMGEHWDALLDVASRLPAEKRAELVDIVSGYADVDPELVERVRLASERYGAFAWPTSVSRSGESSRSAYS